MRVYIKHMVSLRCKVVVQEILTGLGFRVSGIELGEVEIDEPIDLGMLDMLRCELRDVGLELMENKKMVEAGRIRTVIEFMAQHAEEVGGVKISTYLPRQLHRDYTYLANLFSEVKGLTIKKYYILRKVRVVKKYLSETAFTLADISYRMNYSSVSHLCSQFKKVTGLTPTLFRKTYGEKSLHSSGLRKCIAIS